MSWIDRTMVGFDTETTGVRTSADRIVTAALITRTGAEVSARTWLIDPGVEIPAAAAAVHGVTTERARSEGAEPRVALEEIAAALADALNADTPVVAYNAQFDFTILEAELERHGLPSLASRLRAGEVRPVVDPLTLDRKLDRFRRGKRKLIDLCTLYAVPVVADELHAADADVAATLELVHALAAAYPSLRDAELDSLHDFQRVAFHDWAVHFSAYLKSKGVTDDLPDPRWPVARDAAPGDRVDTTTSPDTLFG